MLALLARAGVWDEVGASFAIVSGQKPWRCIGCVGFSEGCPKHRRRDRIARAREWGDTVVFPTEAKRASPAQLFFALGCTVGVESFTLHSSVDGDQISGLGASHRHQVLFRKGDQLGPFSVRGRLIKGVHDLGGGIHAKLPGFKGGGNVWVFRGKRATTECVSWPHSRSESDSGCCGCCGDTGEVFEEVAAATVSEPVGERGDSEFEAGAVIDLAGSAGADSIHKTPRLLGLDCDETQLLIAEVLDRQAREGAKQASDLFENLAGIVHAFTLAPPTDILFMLIKTALRCG